ncbi:MAG: glycosyltransferase family 39 protein [Protaetiibacter sp.]
MTVETARVQRIAVAVLVALPLDAVIVAAAFLAAGTISAAGDLFTPWVVLPLGIGLSVAGLILHRRERDASRGHLVGALLAVAVAVVWTALQWPYPTEFLRPSRDPGIYTLTGIWLAQHSSPSIDVSQALSLVAGDPVLDAVLGFGYEQDLAIHLQGGDAAPSIVAYGWWAAGIDGALRANLVMGGVALLAVYELARRVLRSPLVALVPVVVLGASMPMIYFARASYTETAAVALFAAAAAVLLRAFGRGRVSDFALAGALAGVASMTRVDATLGFAAMIASFALAGIGSADPPGRAPLLRAFAVFAGAGSLFAGLGILDLLTNYGHYVSDLGAQMKQLWVLLGAVVLASATVVCWRARRMATGRRWTAEWTPRARRRWAMAVSALVVGVMLFWVSRPFWLAYHLTIGKGNLAHVADLQAAAGVTVDPTRSYDEYSLWWFAWYFGWPMLALVTIGLVVLVRRAVLARDAGLMAFLVLSCGVGVVYLNLIRISPDQLWAFRRLLPVITPGFLIAAAVVVAVLWAAPRRRVLARSGAVIAVLALLAGVRVAWTAPLYDDIEFAGQRAEIEAVCESVSGHELTVAADLTSGFALTIRVVCGVDVVTLADVGADERRQSLAALAERGVDAVVVTERPEALSWVGEIPEATVVQPITGWDNTLFGAPQVSGTADRSTWVAIPDSAGRLSAVDSG